MRHLRRSIAPAASLFLVTAVAPTAFADPPAKPSQVAPASEGRTAEAPLTLAMVGSQADRIERVVETERVEIALRVSATGKGSLPLDKIMLRVDPFHDPAGKEGDQPKVDWNQRWATIKQGEDQSFTITATLPSPGSYTTEIRLFAEDRPPVTTRLIVVRKGVPLPSGIEVVGSTAKQVTRGCPALFDAFAGLREVCDPAPRVDVMLREIDGIDKAVIWPLAVATASIKGIGNRDLQEIARPLVVEDEEKPLQETQQKLTAYQGRSFFLRIRGLGAPGVHDGKVRLAVEGHLPLDVPFTIIVRDCWIYAALVIAMGTLGSYGVRRWVGDDRDRIGWRRDIRGLVKRLDALASNAGGGQRALIALMELRSQVDALDTDVMYGRKRTEMETTFKLLSMKVDLLRSYLQAERRIVDVKDSARNAEIQNKLDIVHNTIASPKADEAKLKSAEAMLDTLGTDDALRGQHAKERDELQTAVDSARKKAGPLLKKELVSKVDPELEKIASALRQGDINNINDKFDEARRRFAIALTGALARRMKEPPPAGVDILKWKAAIEAGLGPAQAAGEPADVKGAVTVYANLGNAWVPARIQQLDALAKDAAQKVEAKNQTLVWKDAQRTLLGVPIQQKLEKLSATWENGECTTEDAERTCDEVEAALQAFSRDVLEEQITLRLSAGPTEPEQVVLASLPASAASPAMSAAGSVPSERELTKRIEANDRLVLIVVTLAAIAMGLVGLWARSEAWGSFDDYLTALLWGFGLHQVGNKTFEGLLGLRDSVTKPGT